jgi:hypothetical protein
MEEFDLLHLTLDKEKEEMIVGNGIDGPSIWIVVKGEVAMEAKYPSKQNDIMLERGRNHA